MMTSGVHSTMLLVRPETSSSFATVGTRGTAVSSALRKTDRLELSTMGTLLAKQEVDLEHPKSGDLKLDLMLKLLERLVGRKIEITDVAKLRAELEEEVHQKMAQREAIHPPLQEPVWSLKSTSSSPKTALVSWDALQKSVFGTTGAKEPEMRLVSSDKGYTTPRVEHSVGQKLNLVA